MLLRIRFPHQQSAAARLLALAVVAFATMLAVTAGAGAASASLGGGSPKIVGTCQRTGAETAETDKPSYPHHELVRVRGTGYAPRCSVVVRVTRPDGSVVRGDGAERPGSDRVQTDGSGALHYSYRLNDIDGYYEVAVEGAGGVQLATKRFADAFGLNKLFLNSKTGAEDYQFTAGNTVYAQGSVDAADSTHQGRSYQFAFSDPSGAVKSTTPCTADGSVSATVWGSYLVSDGDPVSTNAHWHVVLKQFLDQRCTTLEKTSASVAFDVARATSYATSGLTTPQTWFGPRGTAYVRATGLRPGQSTWNTTWLLPRGDAACANTAGSDRPSSDAGGALPSGSGAFLQYAPGATGSAWNLTANYDGACPALSATNEGAWTLTLRKDATHFVTLPAFSVDATAPTSSSTSPAYSAGNKLTVSYTASGGGGSDLATVDLYAKGPGDSSYSKVGSDPQPGSSGSFSYSAAGGDGAYSFYTVATDKAGNVEAPPTAADSATTLDTTPPASSADSPAATSSHTFAVSYGASDSGTGVAAVDLYVKRPGDSGYSKVATDAAPGASGSFDYTVDGAAGSYSFYTRATDVAGNVEPAPDTADATTSVALSSDKTPPASQASSPASSATGRVDVSYTAADDDSGVVAVDLYVERPGDDAYRKVATDESGSASGSFSYSADGGDGPYRFYTLATDDAGNTEAAPDAADSSTEVDTTAPDSRASSPQYSTANGFTVSYTASDGAGSGLSAVELWAKGPGDGQYTKVATDSNPGSSGSFSFSAAAGEGAYDFYTVATDALGNVEAAPGSADSTTVFDTTAPTSQAGSSDYSSSNAFTVTYTASDGGAGSGLATVDLYVKRPGDSGFTKTATDATPGSSGSFSYTADAGNGSYSFYTVATDRGGNVEAAPDSADSTTVVDPNAGIRDSVDEIHYTFTGSDSVAFDWRGAATDLRYGLTSNYGSRATAHAPDPMPFSSPGPFQEVQLTGLQPGTTYHYSIGGGPDHTFATAPTADFRFDAEADIGASTDWRNVGTIQSQISGDAPAFVLAVGDLTYGSPMGQASVDQHFDDVMTWSTGAAYMPAWGNHEYENPATDDLRNYKGRFMLPHAQTSPSAPAEGCCGEDWSWFDAGGVRFISYPEPYSSKTWSDWQNQADPVFAAAQADPSVHFIVTFGHRPAYSTGFHTGEVALQSVLNSFGDKYSKYVVNFNGHSHDYERFQPIHGVTHITTGGGGSSLETPWTTTDSRTAFRAFHTEHLRVDVSSTGMRIDAICGPPTFQDDITCVQGSVIDSYTIGRDPPPAPPPPSTLYVDNGDPHCTDAGTGTAAQPFCTIKPAASRVVAGQTVQVASGTYNEQVTVSSSGTAAAPITFTAAPGATVKITGGSDGFYDSGQSWVTIQGFDISGTTADGIVVKNASNVTLRGNHVSYAGQPVSGKIAKGIRLDGATDCTVASNTTDHNTDYGIYLLNGSTRNQLLGNRMFSNARVYTRAASGMRLYSSPGNVVSGNVSHDNEDSGLEFYTNSNNNLVTDNVNYGNGDHGIDDYQVTGQRLIGNTVYNNATAGINLEGTSPGALVENNISVDNGINSTRTKGNIRVDSSSTANTAIDYDVVNLRTSGTMFQWGTNFYASLSALSSATGQERHGIQADPLWTDAAGGDFELKPGSAAIDSADAGASGQPATDADGDPRVDDPQTPNSGTGPRAFDDRGAYEYQPEPPEDAPPNVVLSAAPDSGVPPLEVSADASGSTDTDGTPIDTYRFYFGDGSSTDPQSSPTTDHTYTKAGTYSLKVTVTDTGGRSSSSTTQVTVSDVPPSAALSVTPSAGPAPLKVSADASASTDSDGTPIASYSFDFGDGTSVGPQSGAVADHTYANPGTYTVKMTATDTAGKSSTASRQVVVQAPSDAPPAAKLSVALRPDTGALGVSADASASTDGDSTPIATYAFDFGDGSDVVGPQLGATADHTYALPGTYTVKVTVTDTAGNAASATTEVTVTDVGTAAPVAALAVTPASGTTPLKVSADASASTASGGTSIASYSFDFGDGSAAVGPQSGATADHTYSSPGTYTVKVVVTDSAGSSSSASVQVTANPPPDDPPSAALAVTPSAGTAPLKVSADASASTDGDDTPIASYTFDFGDGSTAAGPQSAASADHTYAAAGTYTVKVTVTDTAGKSAFASTQVKVSPPDQPPAAAVAVSPGSGLAPLAVTADASASTDTDDTPIATYKFDFGDGSTALGPQASALAVHSYVLPGTYTVTVTVTDTAGKSSTATAQVAAAGNLVTNPGFEVDTKGWNTSGGAAGITLTRVAGGHSGSWAAQVANPNSAPSECLLNDSPNAVSKSASGNYTGILWVRADSAGATLKLRFREYAGGTTLVGTATTSAPLTTGWQQVTVSYKPVSPGNSTIDFNAYVTNAPTGTCFYADDAAVYLG